MTAVEAAALSLVALIVLEAVALVIVSSAAVRREQEAYARGVEDGERDGRRMEADAALVAIHAAEAMQAERVRELMLRAQAGQPLTVAERRELATLDRVRLAAAQLDRRARERDPVPPRHDLVTQAENVRDFLAAQAARAARKGGDDLA